MRNILIIFLCAFLSMGAASRSFDGTNDEIDMGNVLNVTTGNASLCVWAKMTENDATEWLIGKASGTGSSAGYKVFQNITTDLISFKVSDGADIVESISTTDVDGVWHWIVGTWNATSEVTILYINGVQEDTDTGGGAVGSLSNTFEFSMGEQGNETEDATGLMAYGMRPSGILTAVEVSELMWKPETVIITARGAFWPLWGDSPEPDISGNGLAGTVNNATTSTDGPPVMFGGGLPI